MEGSDRREETRSIERATAEMFVAMYNAKTGDTYRVVGQPEPPEPDVLCENDAGDKLKLEITMLQDRPRDIQSLLGRSDADSLETLQANNERIRRGEVAAIDTVACFERDVIPNLLDRLRAKLDKQCIGPNVALVMRSTSPLDWDWNLYMYEVRQVLESILLELKLGHPPYDRGIWIVACEQVGPRLYVVAEEQPR